MYWVESMNKDCRTLGAYYEETKSPTAYGKETTRVLWPVSRVEVAPQESGAAWHLAAQTPGAAGLTAAAAPAAAAAAGASLVAGEDGFGSSPKTAEQWEKEGACIELKVGMEIQARAPRTTRARRRVFGPKSHFRSKKNTFSSENEYVSLYKHPAHPQFKHPIFDQFPKRKITEITKEGDVLLNCKTFPKLWDKKWPLKPMVGGAVALARASTARARARGVRVRARRAQTNAVTYARARPRARSRPASHGCH